MVTAAAIFTLSKIRTRFDAIDPTKQSPDAAHIAPVEQLINCLLNHCNDHWLCYRNQEHEQRVSKKRCHAKRAKEEVATRNSIRTSLRNSKLAFILKIKKSGEA
jgi:hypothetical protein